MVGSLSDDVAAGWDAATAGLPAPLVVLDLDAYEANAADLVRRAAGRPVRVASKSVRCRWVLEDVLGRPGFSGVMAYALPEAVWLASAGVRDVFVAYPSVHVEALRAVVADEDLRREVTVTVDSVEHVRWLREVLGDTARGLGVAVDVDASVRVGRLHLGVRRSPTRTPAEALAVVRAAQGVGLEVRGVMFYDAQVAGLPDSAAVRVLKRRSVRELLRAPGRRRRGGAGRGGPAVRQRRRHGEPAHLRRRHRRHRARRRVRPVRPDPLRRVRRLLGPAGDGLRAAGRPPPRARHRHDVRGRLRRQRSARLVAGALAVQDGASLVRSEAAGEVQTPVEGDVGDLRIGDRVWMRGAKAGELLERFDVLHLVRGDSLVATVPTYRGEGRNFG